MTAGESGWPGHRFALTLAAVVLAASVAIVTLTMRSAALPPDAHGKMIAVFAPGMGEEQVFAALTRAGGRPLRDTWISGVWVVSGDEAGFVSRLESEGAIGAYAELPFSPQLVGCFAYADARMTELFTVRP